MEPIFTFLTHIASQLLNKYLPIRFPSDLPSSYADSAWQDEALRLKGDDWIHESVRWGHWYGENAEDSSKSYFWDLMPFLEPLAIAAQRHLNQCYQAKAKVMVRGNSGFPPLLAAITDCPWAFSYWGEEEVFAGEAVALVGARKATPFALSESFEFGCQAADCGYVVVSGGAFGCDIASHRGVLESLARPAPAIVVMASGLGSLYPRANHPWFREIYLRGGVIMSERLWWAPCFPSDFLVRNRIISGLSYSTCVMQASRRSGAMTTARLALDQGRDVLVLMGDKDDARTEGNQRLIEEGATPFARSVCLFSEGLLH